jgi:hypothetical protein
MVSSTSMRSSIGNGGGSAGEDLDVAVADLDLAGGEVGLVVPSGGAERCR